MGASEGLQSLFGHSWDSVFPLLVSNLEYSEISTGLSYSRTVLLHFDVLLIPIQTSISSMFSLCIPYLVFHALQDWFFILNVDLPSWVRVQGSSVRFSERSGIDQQTVTVD